MAINLNHYILKGKRVINLGSGHESLMEWGKWMEADNKRVAYTKTKKHFVSTVFLGLDHSFGGKRPILFETMVFTLRRKRGSWTRSDGKPAMYHPSVDGVNARYSTYGQAVKGHKKAVSIIKAMEHGRSRNNKKTR